MLGHFIQSSSILFLCATFSAHLCVLLFRSIFPFMMCLICCFPHLGLLQKFLWFFSCSILNVFCLFLYYICNSLMSVHLLNLFIWCSVSANSHISSHYHYQSILFVFFLTVTQGNLFSMCLVLFDCELISF